MIDFDQQKKMMIEGCAATRLAAGYGTPLYVYSSAQLKANCSIYAGLQAPFPVSTHYAVKANPNLTLLENIKAAGLGFDVVSGGELERCLRIGAEPKTIVYSGVGKTEAELVRAMDSGLGCINIESAGECERITHLAQQRQHPVRLAIRVNPDIAVDSHPYIATALASSKFGVPLDQALRLAKLIAAAPNCNLVGLGCHLGSMLEDLAPLVAACRQLVALATRIAPHSALEHLSLGGGLAVRYKNENQPLPQDLVDSCTPMLKDTGLSLLLEPGRSIIASAGLLLTRVEHCKTGAKHNFAIVDAAMNDLLRPALYDAWHEIVAAQPSQAPLEKWDVVGPVCESGDFIGKDRELAIAAGDVLAVCTTGAYGASMASNYNCRPHAAAVLVQGASAKSIAMRQTDAQMLAAELEVIDSSFAPI